MSSFDIENLLDFEPPVYRCVKCMALWKELPLPEYEGRFGVPIRCPQCGVEYVPTEYCERAQFKDFLRVNGCAIKIHDPLGHARQLGQIARNLKWRHEPYYLYWNYPYLKALLQVLTLAKSFVHFTSFGLTPFMLGALKLAAQRVFVNGVVSANSSSGVATLLAGAMDNTDEAKNLELRVLASEGSSTDLPHQKLVVIDGLLAFKGSANFTEYAWRKAEQSLEEIEAITDVTEVIALNNKFFSSAWLKADKNKASKQLEMTLEEPPWGPLELHSS